MQLTQDDIDLGAVVTIVGVQTENPMEEVTNVTSSHEETSMARLPGIVLGDEGYRGKMVVDNASAQLVSIVDRNASKRGVPVLCTYHTGPSSGMFCFDHNHSPFPLAYFESSTVV